MYEYDRMSQEEDSHDSDDSDRRRHDSDSDRDHHDRRERRVRKVIDELQRSEHPLGMWTDVLHRLVEDEVWRRVEEEMYHRGCGGHGPDQWSDHGPDNGPEGMRTPEYYWHSIDDEEKGMRRDEFVEGWTESDPYADHEEIHGTFDGYDWDKNGHLNR